jgi:predicted anti-sigma-YlaC factor YlaD
MRCLTCRELLSVRLDGEATEVEEEAVDSHLSACPACVAYRAALGRHHREMRLHAAEPVPDLTEAILRTAGVAPGAAVRAADRRMRVLTWARYGLLAVALTQIVWAVPELVHAGGGEHGARHLGAWDLAFAVGLLVVARQPERARGLLPMAAALAGVMVVTATVDVIDGTTVAMAESTHLLEVVGLVLLWAVSWANGRRRGEPSERLGLVPRHLGPAA